MRIRSNCCLNYLAAITCLFPLCGSHAQSPVSVGAGSYASFPPAHEDVAEFVEERPLYIEAGVNRPVPTNDWWTDLIFSEFGGELWAYPMVIDPEAHGFEVRFPINFNSGGNDIVRGPALTVSGLEFAPSDARAADWSDWSVLARMRNGEERIDATLVHGAPFVWFETFGLRPTLGVPADATFSDSNGEAVSFPFTGSRLAVNAEGRSFGVHLPAGTVVTQEQLSFLKIDLGAERSFDAITIHWEAAYGKAYEVQTSSDNSTWETLRSISDGNGDKDEITGLRARARYLRLRLLEEGTQYPFSIWELEVFDDGALISKGATASGSSIQINHLPGHVTDGDPSTRWAADFGSSDSLILQLQKSDGYVVISALPESKDLGIFDKYARNIPRKTRLDYNYEVPAGKISTTWTVETENLEGGIAGDTLQGFIPHHYKNTKTAVFFGPYAYTTSRGALKLAAGRNFSFAYDFHGIPAHYSAPRSNAEDATPFDPAVLRELVDNYAKKDGYGGDTYWGGKDLLKLAHHTLIAKESGHPDYEKLKLKSRTALADWLTYTEGETEHYYAYYPRYKALVGFNESYGSSQFTDHHFHYGYLVHSAALHAMAEPEFLEEYGDMVRLVLREYADWQRDGEDDGKFPWLRTFDPWIGHSYAGGTSSPTGNNQESTSEAVQSWIGMFLLGDLLGDDAMRATGAFGYLTETRATMEYWFDRDGENWPESYDKSIVGILFNGGYVYGTFFSASPIHIHGIQYLPIAPGFKYLAEDPAWALRQYEALMAEAAQVDGQTKETQFGNDWAQVALGMRLLWDAPYVTEKLEKYRSSDNGVLNDPVSAITYYFAHAQQNLGLPSYAHHTDFPISTVYINDGRLTTIAYNPSAETRICTIYDRAMKPVDRFEVGPRSLVTHPSSN